MTDSVSDILARLVPDEMDALLGRVLGGTFRRRGDGGRYRIQATGAFHGYLTENLLAWAGHPKQEVALVVLDEESERVIHFHGGLIIAATSNVLFERLGRVLYKNEVITHDDADALVRVEEDGGAGSVIGWVPDDVLRWAVERRVHEVVAALTYVSHGHFVIVEGEAPLQGLPSTALEPHMLGAKARRLYDAWRRGASESSGPEDRLVDRPAPLPGPLKPPRTREEEIQDILRQLRDADIRLE